MIATKSTTTMKEKQEKRMIESEREKAQKLGRDMRELNSNNQSVYYTVRISFFCFNVCVCSYMWILWKDNI